MVSAIPSDICCFILRLNHCNSFCCYCAGLAYTEGRRKKSQKIDDLPILATWYFSDAFQQIKVTVLLLMEALNYDL